MEPLKIRWYMAVLAVVLIGLSTIEEVKIGDINFTGGQTFATLAAIVLMWPLICRFVSRGGSAEFLGLKLQLENLEKTTEENYGLQIEELRSDIEELRGRKNPTLVMTEVDENSVDDGDFLRAVAQYRENQELNSWKQRVAADKKLVSGGGRLPASYLRKVVEEYSTDQELQMAAAVSLGLVYPGDLDTEAAKMLVELLGSPFERVRFRAAKSIERRGRRSDTTEGAWRIMLEGIRGAAAKEKANAVFTAMENAVDTL